MFGLCLLQCFQVLVYFFYSFLSAVLLSILSRGRYLPPRRFQRTPCGSARSWHVGARMCSEGDPASARAGSSRRTVLRTALRRACTYSDAPAKKNKRNLENGIFFIVIKFENCKHQKLFPFIWFQFFKV